MHALLSPLNARLCLTKGYGSCLVSLSKPTRNDSPKFSNYNPHSSVTCAKYMSLIEKKPRKLRNGLINNESVYNHAKGSLSTHGSI